MTFARAEVLTDGGYGAVNLNYARELVAQIVKIRQREIMVASNLLLASSSSGSEKTANEMLRSFLNNVYTDHEQKMQEHDEALRRELELMNKVDWASALSIPKGVKEMASKITRTAKSNDGIDEVLS